MRLFYLFMGLLAFPIAVYLYLQSPANILWSIFIVIFGIYEVLDNV